MYKLIYVLFIILVVIILISNTCTFPLSGGSIQQGLQAINNLSKNKYNTKNYPFVAIIVEPRKENLLETIKLFMQVLPMDTHIQIYHGTENANYVLNGLSNLINSGKISLWNLGVTNLTINSYSALLTSRVFWETVQSEKVLIFQTDAVVCNRSTINLYEFMKYDFVGAPLPSHIHFLVNILFMCKGYILNHTQFYNGGLSLRSRSKMLQVIDKYPWDQLTPEDIWFCSFLPRINGLLPDVKTARKFSYESEELSCIPWGVHKPRSKYDTLCKICPEVGNIPFVPAFSDYRNLYLI